MGKPGNMKNDVGTVLGVATGGFSIHIIAGVLVFAVLFTLIRLLLKNELRDLA